ncbi:MAG: flavodoxin domain-containing protein [Candidatus Bathyarchaeia archaeon]
MKIAILYDSRTGNTEKLAGAIAEGVEEAGAEADVKKIGQRFPLSKIGDVDAVMFGSPVIYADVTECMRDFVKKIDRYVSSGRIDMTGRVAAVFGSYGWDGAWIMEERLRAMVKGLGYNVYEDVLVETDSRIKHNPKAALSKARAFGKSFAKSL